MVIVSPAIPSETVKLDPIEVSRPIGRISVVTMAKIPSITETTASHPVSGDREDRSWPLTEAEVVAGMVFRPVKGSAFRDQSSRSHREVAGGSATAPLPFVGDVAFLPAEMGFGSGMTCWRRLRDWNEAGV
ncbi:hypothetical protein GCM10010339_21680 [Streptomyces alanosinicus]|uniref:Transposase n=1 Tax=Streptomyces alanosinicus TaxID=68171 RepID=A0A918YFW0_9ACTN|nr:hypothetical protein GCM10010339_21680 [Streptomyces alanosinicus]